MALSSLVVGLVCYFTICLHVTAFSPPYPAVFSSRTVDPKIELANNVNFRSRLHASRVFDGETVKRGVASALLVGSLASGSNVVGAFESPSAYAPLPGGFTDPVKVSVTTGQAAPSRDMASLGGTSVVTADTLSSKPKPTAEEIQKKKVRGRKKMDRWRW